MRPLFFFIMIGLIFSCGDNDNFASDNVGGQNQIANGCEGAFYPNWEVSRYVLPYPVGQSYRIGLSNCGGFPHVEGEPDQFAIDFIMDIGTLVTASRKGTIMFVEESGNNFESTNNTVVLRDEDGLFLQYQHLTKDGALVEVGDFVERGDPIGFSGASGATYAHLHFVATGFDDWMFPYSASYPVTFRNTSPNPKSLIQDETYEALP
ncbi:MAG: M23 family metallopeptidase, partial [Flavobacteriaceae bacterium]|nr:M23 family metallopeptidase [Flavobacteriaceae bacterium]